MKDLPTKTVELNHLEAMGIGMSLYAEQARDGLSGPQKEALEKIEVVIGEHMKDMGRPG